MTWSSVCAYAFSNQSLDTWGGRFLHCSDVERLVEELAHQYISVSSLDFILWDIGHFETS